MRIVKLTEKEKSNILENLLKRSPSQYGEYEASVSQILEDAVSYTHLTLPTNSLV